MWPFLEFDVNKRVIILLLFAYQNIDVSVVSWIFDGKGAPP